MKKKRAFTLLEIMIVIFLIGLIGSIVGYSMKGSLAEGKAFKTKQAIVRVTDLLELELARGATPAEINDNIEGVLTSQGVVKNVKSLLRDGWGKDLKVHVNVDGEIKVTSAALEEYEAKKEKERGYKEHEM
jgi:prepilin-type N-terminal cleavage/methylation domain-containing protein